MRKAYLKSTLHKGRYAGTGTTYDRYDEEYNPTSHLPRVNAVKGILGVITYRIKDLGVDGVMLPNHLTEKEYQEYVNSKAGEVRMYNLYEKRRRNN